MFKMNPLLGRVFAMFFAYMFMYITPEEMQQEVTKGLKEHADAVEKLEKSHKETDGKIDEMSKKMTDFGQASVDDKNKFKELEQKAIDNEKAVSDIASKLEKGFGGVPEAQKGLGALAAANENIKTYEGGSLMLANYKGNIFEKAITSVGASAGSLIQPMRESGIVSEPFEELPIRDLLMAVPVSTNAVEWVAQLLRINNAAAVAEGALKPTSDLTYELKSTPIITLAHLFKASKQVLDDATQLMGEINTEGLFGIRETENTQLLIGTGAGGNIHGLIPQATAYNAALSKSGDTKIDQIRRAMLQMTIAKYNATALVLNPADWCDLELAKDANNNYLFTSPVNGVGGRLWGRPVREALSMSPGEFLLGAFNRAATLYDRENVNVRISEENNDDFEKNMLTIRIEERVGLAVKRPLALVTGTLAATV